MRQIKYNYETSKGFSSETLVDSWILSGLSLRRPDVSDDFALLSFIRIARLSSSVKRLGTSSVSLKKSLKAQIYRSSEVDQSDSGKCNLFTRRTKESKRFTWNI